MLWVPNPPIYLLHSALHLLDSEFFLPQSSLLLHAEYDDGKQQKLERGGEKKAGSFSCSLLQKLSCSGVLENIPAVIFWI